MSRIVRNSVLNGAAMGLTSVLSLILVPVLIGRYGLEAYGLIPLVRLLTPLGAIGMATLGLPQLATRAAALNAARHDAEALRRAQSTLVAASVVLGACAAAVMLALGWERFAGWFNIEEPQYAPFSTGFDLAAILLPLLLPGFVLSASFTGLGRFGTLRLTEVGVYLLYFAASIAAVWAGRPVGHVIIVFLTADALRAAALLLCAHRFALIDARAVLVPDVRWLAAQGREFAVLSVSSLLGYTRKHLAASAIALVFGPAALGLYDAIERVPRAFKSLLGLVNTAVLPHALRLDTTADAAVLRSLLVRGTRLTLLCTVPIAAGVMLYAGPIVSTWLGAGLAHGGPLLVLLMIPFVLDATMSIVVTASLSRLELISSQNRIAIAEILIFLGVLAACAQKTPDAAPYLATAVAAAAGYVLRLRLFLPAYGITSGQWLGLSAKVVAGSALGAGCVALGMRLGGAPTLVVLASGALAVLAGVATVIALWNAEERKDLRAVLTSLRSMLSAGAR